MDTLTFYEQLLFLWKTAILCILFAWQHTMEVIAPKILLEMEATQNQIDEESQPVDVAKERRINQSKPPSLILTTICLVQFQEPSSHNQTKRGGTLSSLSSMKGFGRKRVSHFQGDVAPLEGHLFGREARNTIDNGTQKHCAANIPDLCRCIGRHILSSVQTMLPPLPGDFSLKTIIKYDKWSQLRRRGPSFKIC